MSEVEQRISALERQLKQGEDQMELRAAAQRLYKNRDFRKLIVECFMRDEAARYVQASCDPALDERSRADALAIAQASGHLKRFLSVVITMGNHAEDQVQALNFELDEARGVEEGSEEEAE
jgi:hypothetical protein